MIGLPKKEESLWREVYKSQKYSSLKVTLAVDVAIVGGGITGLTAAYLLKQSGLKVAVLEKATIGGGTTGRTTGKVTSQHNLVYNDLQQRLGKKTARIYGHANQTAVEQIAAIIKKERINCDWQREDNYVYTADPLQLSQFKQEAKTAKSLGLPASFVTNTPLPFKIKGAVKFSNQAKVHAQRYLLGLAKAINGSGSHIFEASNVVSIRDGKQCRVRTAKASVHAKAVIVATNVPTLPLLARGGFCLLEYPTESYIVAGRLPKNITGMYISPDKQHYSILPVNIGGKNLVLIGGESNLSGLRLSKRKKYQRLADYAVKHFEVSEITNVWADRDYMTYDGPPLIGKLYPWSKNLYVASAFCKWGLSNGTVASMILHDLITGQENEWSEVFSTRLLKPVGSIPRVAVQHLMSPFRKS